MRVGLIFLICGAMLLSGCAVWPNQSSGESIGRTYEQLVEAKRLDQQVTNYWDARGTYYCDSCDGQPTRTYTNPAGNKVVTYLYIAPTDYLDPPVTVCEMLEERYELRNDVVVDEWFFVGGGEWFPFATKNVCAGYNGLNDNDPPAGQPHPPTPWGLFLQKSSW